VRRPQFVDKRRHSRACKQHQPAESFTLEIKADQFIRRCRRVWSRDKRIGVAFS
jgi:hypothetical protein